MAIWRLRQSRIENASSDGTPPLPSHLPWSLTNPIFACPRLTLLLVHTTPHPVGCWVWALRAARCTATTHGAPGEAGKCEKCVELVSLQYWQEPHDSGGLTPSTAFRQAARFVQMTAASSTLTKAHDTKGFIHDLFSVLLNPSHLLCVGRSLQVALESSTRAHCNLTAP